MFVICCRCLPTDRSSKICLLPKPLTNNESALPTFFRQFLDVFKTNLGVIFSSNFDSPKTHVFATAIMRNVCFGIPKPHILDHLSIMFSRFSGPRFGTSLFSFFGQHDTTKKKGTPFGPKLHPKWQPKSYFSSKIPEISDAGCSLVTFLEPTGVEEAAQDALEAARTSPGLNFFHTIWTSFLKHASVLSLKKELAASCKIYT